ncbi:hypothetical protein [Blautia sp.]|uniref:hypothetical protein n=1 Tax=Blautia sp. TaxID=1955243 RepID=UPI003D91BEC5
MSMYVYAPAGAINLRNLLLKYGVEFIGSKQPGHGSNWAKGKRYIKEKLMCSGTAIKRACVVKNKIIHHDFEEYGVEVYYYHKDFSAQIVKVILEYIVMNINDPELPQGLNNADFHALLERTYSHRISQVKWVSIQDYKGQGEIAEHVYNELNSLS